MRRGSIVAAISTAVAFIGLGACAQQPDAGFGEQIAGKLVRADGSEAPADALQGKTVLVYFSAHWCPPCRRFTPELVKVYDEWKRQDKPVELVFVSSDRDEAAMRGYMTEMGMKWLAVPYADRGRMDALSRRWNVRGIPTLVAVSPDGKTLTQDGVGEVYEKKAAALDAWLPAKP